MFFFLFRTVIAKPKEFFKRSQNDNSTNEIQASTNDPNCGQYYGEGAYNESQCDNLISQQIVPGTVHSSTLNSSTLPANMTGHFNNSGGGLNSANSHSTKCTSDDESSTSITSGSGQVASGGNHSFNNSAHLSSSPLKMKPLSMRAAAAASNAKHSSDLSFEMVATSEFEQLHRKLDERSEDCVRLSSDLNCLKGQYQNDVHLLNQALQDEKYRVDVSFFLCLHKFNN